MRCSSSSTLSAATTTRRPPKRDRSSSRGSADGWRGGRGIGAAAFDADQLLSWKYGYGDGDFGSWTRSDVGEVLLEHLPRKLSASSAEAASIPESLNAFVQYLDEAGLLAEGSDDAGSIADRAIAQRQAFLEAMDDPANWGMAKLSWSAQAPFRPKTSHRRWRSKRASKRSSAWPAPKR